MNNKHGALNEVLVELFNHVLDTESKAVITEEFKDISNNDMHIMEAIGIREPRNVSQIAKSMNVTVGTLTVNMNSLEKKGYILRERSTADKRVVFVTLTEKGRKAFFHHRDFHKAMIRAAVKDLDQDEMNALMNCLVKLNVFFKSGKVERDMQSEQ